MLKLRQPGFSDGWLERSAPALAGDAGRLPGLPRSPRSASASGSDSGTDSGSEFGVAPPLHPGRPFSLSVRAAALYTFLTEPLTDPRRFTP